MRHPPQSRWQQKVFEDVLKERRYQERPEERLEELER